jgi:sulfonate transport system substrate-binding protein
MDLCETYVMTHDARGTKTRREVMTAAGAACAAGVMAFRGFPARAGSKTIRIGYQKYGTLILLKGKGLLENALAPLGYAVAWSEFPAGPQLLEALNVGAVDFGSTGEAPPIIAQAAGAPLIYVAHEPPAPRGEAILVKTDSPLHTVADLKGKSIALNKGSNVHYLLVRALEKSGIAYNDVKTVFLSPADARAAFEQGAVDAWAIWDPFQAAAESANPLRELATGEGVVANRQFYLAAKTFVDGDPEAIDVIQRQIGELDTWANGAAVVLADQLSRAVGIPSGVLKVALKRQTFGVTPLSAEVVADQQRIADAFLSLGLIPKPITVSDVVRKAAS